jgi:alpha/beta superfamily hydrolase
MVLKGQFLERPTLIPVTDELVLEGVSHRGDARPGLLVLPPPPLEGSGMDHVVGAELAFAVSHAGHPTVRFNYRGVGGSQGQPSRSPNDWLADARAALQLAMDNTEGSLVVVATIGASDAVALRLAELHPLAGLILINPSLAQPSDFEVRASLPWPLAVVLAELDERQDRARWAAALARHEAPLTVVPGATRTYQRNLPMVGKAAASLVGLAGAGRREAP